MFGTAYEQALFTLAVAGCALLVMAVAVVAGGYVRDCSGQHAGAGPGATTVAHIQAHLAAEAARHFTALHPRPTTPTTPKPSEPEEYTGRHRLPESHPDHGVPLDAPRPRNQCHLVRRWVPCGHVVENLLGASDGCDR